jgi:protein PhnA
LHLFIVILQEFNNKTMGIESILKNRSGATCELCKATENLSVFEVQPPADFKDENASFLSCATCIDQIENPDHVDPNHWRCLNDSMWSEVPAVQAIAWRMLSRLKHEGWPQDLLDMLYLEEDLQEWAAATAEVAENENNIIHRDSNGNILNDGDSVVLIKDLVVKGANFTAKRGAAVHRISLVWDNEQQLEGRIDGQHIVILTQYVKKTKSAQ